MLKPLSNAITSTTSASKKDTYSNILLIYFFSEVIMLVPFMHVRAEEKDQSHKRVLK